VATADNSIRVPLRLLLEPSAANDRHAEPVTIGVPFPRALTLSETALTLEDDHGSVLPLQVRALDAWSDSSLRWALLDFTIDVREGHLSPRVLRIAGNPVEQPPRATSIRVEALSDGVRVDTGRGIFDFRRGQAFPCSSAIVNGRPAFDGAASHLFISVGGSAVAFDMASVDVVARGPLRVELAVRATARDRRHESLDVFARVELFAGKATMRASITLRNTRRARHPGGEWELGDPGSVLIDFATWRLVRPTDTARVSVAAGVEPEPAALPLEIYQDSSGGESWNHRTHVNRRGVVPLSFRGYRLRTADHTRTGLRAWPVVHTASALGSCAVALPAFWQNCPRAISVDDRTIAIGLFPEQFVDGHELQGGEQKTHVIVVDFGGDQVSDPPLSWVHDPVRVYLPPAWSCATGVLPFVAPADADDEEYRRIVSLAFDGEQGFDAKRERFDEYGWRHFGDLPGDHESAFQPAGQPFVSHYNNQYDALGAFGVHFLRTGDVRWWQLMDELAGHVRDIDIYHTQQDRSAYNGGLFWHTQHYMDAGTSTHRTYPRGSGGGGPSSEHNYAGGLMLHHFLTGDPASRDAAVGLGRWVIDMDDGSKTPLRWLAAGPTGMASATGAADYHGPGRGSANSILACLAARRLSGEPAFAAKAEELIRRCIHPRDDLAARNLLDAERRWYYTVFLQALGIYLYEKAEQDDLDDIYAYARASLLHYARWMVEHEVPYLSRPEVLEYPTETWAAQDLRKAEVFWWAAAHADQPDRQRFLERAEFFFRDAIATLDRSPTRHFTRPLVLALGNGVRHSGFRAQSWTGPARDLAVPDWPPSSFVPQKARAIRRARIVAAAAAAAGLGGLLFGILAQFT
jgi:hypothetical protein